MVVIKHRRESFSQVGRVRTSVDGAEVVKWPLRSTRNRRSTDGPDQGKGRSTNAVGDSARTCLVEEETPKNETFTHIPECTQDRMIYSA